jgi:hypothetical protein
MGPGLARMLDMIIKTPADTMLVDRFLVLASDIPESERVDATLKLAKALSDKQPRRALEVAWMLYKSGLKDSEALQLICDLLEAVNRSEKAQLIRAEMRRLADLKISAEARLEARKTIENHVNTTLAERGWVSFSFDAEVTRTDQLPAAPALEQASGYHDDVSPARSKMIVAAPESLAEFSEGIPEPIPPKEPSRHLSVLNSDNPKSTSTRYSIRRGASEENPTSTTGYSAHRRGMTIEEKRQRLKDMVAAEEWGSVLELLDHSFTSADDPILLKVFEEGRLARIDVRFAGWWVDILIASKQERRALRFMLQKLADEPHVSWAREFWPKVCVISECLHLEPVQWQERDGVSELRTKIASLRPRGGCYVV